MYCALRLREVTHSAIQHFEMYLFLLLLFERRQDNFQCTFFYVIGKSISLCLYITCWILIMQYMTLTLYAGFCAFRRVIRVQGAVRAPDARAADDQEADAPAARGGPRAGTAVQENGGEKGELGLTAFISLCLPFLCIVPLVMLACYR